MKHLFFVLLAFAPAALAYSFSGGYHPIPHVTPHFSTPVHVSPHLSPPPHWSPPMTHVTPSYSHPNSAPAGFSPLTNPMHPAYWVFWGRHNGEPPPRASGFHQKWLKPPSRISPADEGVSPWRIALWIAAGIIGVSLLVWGCYRLTRDF